MAIIRQGPVPEDYYTMISNELARDTDVSLEAKGLYLFMRSHKSGWTMSTERIGEALGINRGTVGKYINELEDCGYLQKEQSRVAGKFQETTYVLMALKLQDGTVAGKTGDGKTVDGKTGDGKTSNIRRLIPSKKTNSKEEQNLKPEFEAGFDAFWVKYPRKAGKDKAREKYAAALETSTVDELQKAVTVFADECQHQQTELRYIPYPGTWLNQKRYLDYLNAAPRKKSGKEKIDAALSWDVTKM